MDTQWIVTEIDGKVASIAADYRHFASIASVLASRSPKLTEKVSTYKISTQELTQLHLGWDDMCLFGSKFQLGVWKTLFEMERHLYSYSDFAALAGNPLGVRAVAHAVAINPVAYVIPCHLVVPKESLDKVPAIRETARTTTLFQGSDLYRMDSIDVGDYAYGPELKRELIKIQLSK